MFDEVGQLRVVEPLQQAVRRHHRDVLAGRHDDVVAAGPAGGAELRDHLLVRAVAVELHGHAGLAEGVQVAGVVVVAPAVDVELVLDLAVGAGGCGERGLAAAAGEREARAGDDEAARAGRGA